MGAVMTTARWFRRFDSWDGRPNCLVIPPDSQCQQPLMHKGLFAIYPSRTPRKAEALKSRTSVHDID